MPLPLSCDTCGFYRPSLCHRHAPGPVPVRTPLVRARWPIAHATQRCGEGDTGGTLTTCGVCIYWVRLPDVTAPKQHNRTVWTELVALNKPDESLVDYGRCVRYAMSPSEDDVHMDHKITHATDFCGEGESPPDDSDGSL